MEAKFFPAGHTLALVLFLQQSNTHNIRPDFISRLEIMHWNSGSAKIISSLPQKFLKRCRSLIISFTIINEDGRRNGMSTEGYLSGSPVCESFGYYT